jgi:hypothetical protein
MQLAPIWKTVRQPVLLLILFLSACGLEAEETSSNIKHPLETNHVASNDAIEQLVARLSATHGLWINGAFPIIKLPAEAAVEQVISNVFEMTGFDKGHVTEHSLVTVRPVKIGATFSDTYTAALVETDLGPKIILLKYQGSTLGWWSRVYPAEASQNTNGMANALRVVAIASTNEVRVAEPFKVALRVENRTKTNQTIRVMNCSWDEHWRSSHPAVSWIGRSCSKNFAVDVKLATDGAYTNQLEMFVTEGAVNPKVSFRMGFTPINETNTFWSDVVLMTVKP